MSYEIRDYRPGDETSILATFNLVFGEHDPGFVARTPDVWRWVFTDNPAGFRILVAEHEGSVVAQAAGQPYRVRVDGEDRYFVNGVDSMTHPDHRRGLKRPGLFVRVALAFHERYEGLDRDLLHFGLPIHQAARIGERFLGYRLIREQLALARDLSGAPEQLPEEVEVLERFDDRVAALYERCAGGWGASTIRDAAYMNWRYVDAPGRRYLPLGVVGDDGALLGLAVYRHGDWVHDNVGFIVDWLVPDDAPEVGALLRRAVLAQARRDGADAVGTIQPEWAKPFLTFQEEGWRVIPTGYGLRCRPTHLTTDWLRDHWWYQLGDTDLF